MIDVPSIARICVATLLVFGVAATAVADEGQWPPDRLVDLDWPALKKRGLRLAPGDIWDEGGRKAPLAAAVVRVGGCSGAFVGKYGLILTNHHCAYRAIQQNSTPEANLLQNGFVASTWADEKPAAGLIAEVLQSFRDVTQKVEGTLSAGLSDRERFLRIDRRKKELVAECESRPSVRCRIASEFGGLRHVLFESLELRDIRLVHAPPEAVGEFGGEVDNWSWPRHTGDFSLMRAYVAPDGSTAAYASENVPFTPQRHLALSTRGVRPGDLVMVAGYPGSTDRYLPADGVEQRVLFEYPERVRVYARWMAILEDEGRRDEAARITLARATKSVANRLKNARGMIAGLRRNQVVQRKRAEEKELREWAARDPGRSAHLATLQELEDLEVAAARTQQRDFFLRHLERISVTFGFARTILENAREREKPDLERRPGYQERDQERMEIRLRRAQRDLDAVAERRLTAWFLEEALRLPDGQRVMGIDAALATDPSRSQEARRAAVNDFVEDLYAGTRLGDLDARLQALAGSHEALQQSQDAMLEFARALQPEYDEMRFRMETRSGARQRLLPGYSKLLMERRARVYPDASSTLRISFATVKGYTPREAVWMEPQTTLAGVLEKETGEAPFASPARVLAAARQGDLGRWRQAGLGSVPVCFLSDADTTGGNSGSPVLNGRGELVGVNFDRVWENVAGDYGYNPAVSRNISVDVRYLLWMLERVDRAFPLLREMGIEPSAALERPELQEAASIP